MPTSTARVEPAPLRGLKVLLLSAALCILAYPSVYLAPLANAHINAIAKKHAKPTGEAILHWIYHLREEYYEVLGYLIWAACWMGIFWSLVGAWVVCGAVAWYM